LGFKENTEGAQENIQANYLEGKHPWTHDLFVNWENLHLSILMVVILYLIHLW
jgi:hypothetical protein